LPALEDYVNVIVADKQEHLQYLTMEQAIDALHQGHRHLGLGQQRRGAGAGCGDGVRGRHPTMEALAAVAILREHCPDLKIRFVNVVDSVPADAGERASARALDRDFDSLFTTDKPVIFNFHSYASLIHKLSYRRGITTTSTCAATRKKATSTRRWSWRSSIRWIASTWRSM
jgi:xylulose-5-phosphate/fructose-6-phosphate phosphoketolase